MDRYLRMDWSPWQVAGFLGAEGILSISHETVYLHVWADKRAEVGHWEIDTVMGTEHGRNSVVTMVERATCCDSNLNSGRVSTSDARPPEPHQHRSDCDVVERDALAEQLFGGRLEQQPGIEVVEQSIQAKEQHRGPEGHGR